MKSTTLKERKIKRKKLPKDRIGHMILELHGEVAYIVPPVKRFKFIFYGKQNREVVIVWKYLGEEGKLYHETIVSFEDFIETIYSHTIRVIGANKPKLKYNLPNDFKQYILNEIDKYAVAREI